MRILVVHNFYQQPGGEDEVFASEVALLRKHGHDLRTFEADNDAVESMGRLKLLRATLWNRESFRAIGQAARAHRAQIVHFHNTFPLISPAAYAAARQAGAAVVQTLHNFRLLCPNAVFFREGRVCEKCLSKHFAWPGIVHNCYRGSRGATLAVAVLHGAHRALGTWANGVDAYIAPTEFARAKFVAGGLPVEKIFVKPNFLDPDPGIGAGDGGYAVFVGRLSHEKGLGTLLAAWEKLTRVPLKIIGDGPLACQVEAAMKSNPQIQWLGRRSPGEVYDAIGRAAMLIFPSQCYETFGRVAVEAYAKGTPVVASRHGAMADIVIEGQSGRLFEPGNAEDLARVVKQLFSDPDAMKQLRASARREYEMKYTGVANHERLLEIYEPAITGCRKTCERATSIPSPGTPGEGKREGSRGDFIRCSPPPSPTKPPPPPSPGVPGEGVRAPLIPAS